MITFWALSMLAIGIYKFLLATEMMNASLDRITISHKNAELLSAVFHRDGIAYVTASIAGFIAPFFLDTGTFYLHYPILGFFVFYNVIVFYYTRQAYRKFVIHDNRSVD